MKQTTQQFCCHPCGIVNCSFCAPRVQRCIIGLRRKLPKIRQPAPNVGLYSFACPQCSHLTSLLLCQRYSSALQIFSM